MVSTSPPHSLKSSRETQAGTSSGYLMLILLVLFGLVWSPGS